MATIDELWDAGNPQAPAGFSSWGDAVSAWLTSGGTLSGTAPVIVFDETDQTPGYRIVATGGFLEVQHSALGDGTDWATIARFDSDGVVSQPVFKDFSEKVNALGNISGAVSVDYAAGSTITATLTGNVTSVTITNPPPSGQAGNLTWILTQDGTGNRTFSLDAAVYKTPGNVNVTLSTAAGSRDYVTMITTNGGTIWDTFTPGKALS